MIFCCCFALDTCWLFFSSSSILCVCVCVCVLFCRLLQLLIFLCAYYGWPAPMAVAFRQPYIDIFAMCLMLSNQFMVNLLLRKMSFGDASGPTVADLRTRSLHSVNFWPSAPDPWSFEPKINRLRRLRRTTTVPSFKKFRSELFILPCKQYTPTHTYIATMPSQYRYRWRRG